MNDFPKQITTTVYFVAWDTHPDNVFIRTFPVSEPMQKMGMLDYGRAELTLDVPKSRDAVLRLQCRGDKQETSA